MADIKQRKLADFKAAVQAMIATKPRSYKRVNYDRLHSDAVTEYTDEQIEDVILSGNPSEMKELSRSYFWSNGFYRRIIFYYAYLLKYAYVVIPHLRDKPNNKTKKNYYNALDYCDNLGLKDFCGHVAVNVLVDGAYYGLIVKKDKKVSTMDLPFDYCFSRYKGFSGLDIVEMDLSYFTTILDKKSREEMFKLYPKDVKLAYQKYISGKGPKTIALPEGIGICFTVYENHPFFLDIIPTLNIFSTYRGLEVQKEENETKKILVQHIGTTKDGELLFEPAEAEVLHTGAVTMLENNLLLDVLTTYAEVKVESLSDARQTINSNLETFQNMIYAEGGVSPNLFAAKGNVSLEQSIKQDLSLMMHLGEKFTVLYSYLLNKEFSSNTLKYSFIILPISYYNESDYIDETYKLAGSGYSFILPALATGLTQKQFLDLKDLENNVLNLEEVLIPLSSQYTQPGNTGVDGKEGGSPTKKEKDKKDKTIQNEGGS